MAQQQQYDTLLLSLVDYVYEYKVTSATAWQTARLALLDALGCAMEALATNAECHTLIGPVVAGTTVPHGFRLPGTAFVLDPVKGAFDMGVLVRYLDHNDGFTGVEWGHPSDNLGAILAVADTQSRLAAAAANAAGGRRSSSGPGPTVSTLLSSIIKAYEIQGVLQLSNSLNSRGLDHVTLVKLASAAVISPLLGLNRQQSLAALSHVFMDGSPLRTYRHAPNTGPRKGWAGGDACMRAVHLARLAKAGQPGAPTALTAPRWGFQDALFGGRSFSLGGRQLGCYVIQHIFFKLMPCEGHALAAVEAAISARRAMDAAGLSVADIATVRIRTHAGAVLIISKQGPMRNAADRDHCLQWMVAVALLKGAPLEYGDYADDGAWAADPRVDTLRGRMLVTQDEGFSRDYLDPNKRSMASGVTVEMEKDGAMVGNREFVVEYPLGNPKNPGTAAAVQTKSRRNLNRLFDEARMSQLEEAVFAAQPPEEAGEEGSMPVRKFVDLMWKGNESKEAFRARL